MLDRFCRDDVHARRDSGLGLGSVSLGEISSDGLGRSREDPFLPGLRAPGRPGPAFQPGVQTRCFGSCGQTGARRDSPPSRDDSRFSAGEEVECAGSEYRIAGVPGRGGTGKGPREAVGGRGGESASREGVRLGSLPRRFRCVGRGREKRRVTSRACPYALPAPGRPTAAASARRAPRLSPRPSARAPGRTRDLPRCSPSPRAPWFAYR